MDNTNENYRKGYRSGYNNPKAFSSDNSQDFTKGFMDGQIQYWKENLNVIPEVKLKI